MPDKRADTPPFLGSWTAIYVLVAGVLGLLILLFYLFTQHFG